MDLEPPHTVEGPEPGSIITNNAHSHHHGPAITQDVLELLVDSSTLSHPSTNGDNGDFQCQKSTLLHPAVFDDHRHFDTAPHSLNPATILAVHMSQDIKSHTVAREVLHQIISPLSPKSSGGRHDTRNMLRNLRKLKRY